MEMEKARLSNPKTDGTTIRAVDAEEWEGV